MSNTCGNRVKHTCGGVINEALCTKYSGILSEHSSLDEGSCLDVQEVIEDIYVITENIYAEINMSELDNECIIFTEPKTVKSIVEQMYLELCQLKSLVETQQETILGMQGEIDDLQTNTCP